MTRKLILLTSIATVLTGCATMAALTPEQEAQLATQVTQGQTVLACNSFECSGNYGLHRNEMQADIRAQNWRALAVLVAHIGYQTDVGYFYLGMAAEGQGADNAALHYYQLAVSGATGAVPMIQCAGAGPALNTCDGVNLPSDAYAHIQAVQVDIARHQAPPPPPPPPQHHKRKRATDWQTPTPDSP